MSITVQVEGNENENVIVGTSSPTVEVEVQTNLEKTVIEVSVDEFAAQTAKDAADRAEQALEDIENAISNKTDRGGFPGTSQDIVDSIELIQYPDTVLKYGEIETDELSVHVDANAFNWRIAQISYTDPLEFNDEVEAASDGFYRTDALLGNDEGGYQIFKGTEDDTSAPEPTNFPDGTIKLGLIHVFGASISGTIIDVSGFITKAEKGFIRMFLVGNIDVVEVDNRSYLKFEEGMLSLKSINIADSTLLYHGREFIIKNGTSLPITIPHNLGTGNFKFNIPGSVNLSIKPEESAKFVMRAINFSNNGGLLDYVGSGVFKEDSSNKKTAIAGNESSDLFFGTIKSWITYLRDSWFSSLATKTTISDTTMFPVEDESDSNKAKVVSWSNIKNTCKTYFDSYFQVKDDQIEISSNTNVQNAWHGKTILFASNCTITVPSSLNNSLMFPFRTLAGVTVTWAITSPLTWESTPVATPEKTVGHFMRRGSTNTIFLDI